MTLGTMRSTSGLVTLVSVLLLVGLGIDLGYTSQKFADLEHARREREQLKDGLVETTRRAQRARELAAALDLEELTELQNAAREDPLAHVNTLLERARLARLELTVTDAEAKQGVQRTQFIVRVTGRYADILTFIRDIEAERPLAAVDAISIERVAGTSKTLEGRLNISIYQAVAET